MDIKILEKKLNIILENRKYRPQILNSKVKRINKYEKKFKVKYNINLNKKLSIKEINKLTNINILQLNEWYNKNNMYKNIILINNI